MSDFKSFLKRELISSIKAFDEQVYFLKVSIERHLLFKSLFALRVQLLMNKAQRQQPPDLKLPPFASEHPRARTLPPNLLPIQDTHLQSHMTPRPPFGANTSFMNGLSPTAQQAFAMTQEMFYSATLSSPQVHMIEASSPGLSEVRRNLMRETDFGFKAKPKWQSPLVLYSRKKQGKSFVTESQVKRIPPRRGTDPISSVMHQVASRKFISESNYGEAMPELTHYFSSAPQKTKRGKAVEKALEGVTARLMQINEAAASEIQRLNRMTQKQALRESMISEEVLMREKRATQMTPFLDGRDETHMMSNTAQFLQNRQTGQTMHFTVAEQFPFRRPQTRQRGEAPTTRRKSTGREIEKDPQPISALSGKERRSNKRASIKKSSQQPSHKAKSQRPKANPMPLQISTMESDKPKSPKFLKKPVSLDLDDSNFSLQNMMRTVERGQNVPDQYFHTSPSRQLSNNSSAVKNASPGRQGSSNKKIVLPSDSSIIYPGLVGKNILTPRSNMLLLKNLESEAGFSSIQKELDEAHEREIKIVEQFNNLAGTLQTKNLPNKPEKIEEVKAVPKKPVYIPFSKKRPVKVERKLAAAQKPREPIFHQSATPVFFKKTKRYFLTRRKRMLGRPLVVFMFEGVIGQFLKSPKMMHMLPEGLLLRPGAQSGLRIIAQHFQVVIFFKRKYPRRGKRVGLVRNYFKSKNIPLDGIYAARKHKSTFYEDYSQIFLDFNISQPKERVLFVNSLELDYDQIRNRCGEHLIRDDSIRPGRFLSDHLPFQPGFDQATPLANKEYLNNNFQLGKQSPPLIFRNKESPVTLLVPHPRLQQREQAIVFRTIAKTIFTLAFASVFCERSIESFTEGDPSTAFQNLKEECISLTGDSFSIKRFGSMKIKFQHRRTLTASSSNNLKQEKKTELKKNITPIKKFSDDGRRVQTAIGGFRKKRQDSKEDDICLSLSKKQLGEELFKFVLRSEEAQTFFQEINWVEGMNHADLKNSLSLKFVTTSLIHEQLRVKFDQKAGLKEHHQYVRFRINTATGKQKKQFLGRLQQNNNGEGGQNATQGGGNFENTDLATTHKLAEIIGLETANEVMRMNIGYKVLNYVQRSAKNYEYVSGYFWRFFPPKDNPQLMEVYLQGSEDPCSGVRRPPCPPPQDVDSDYEELYKDEEVRLTNYDICNNFAILLPSSTFPMLGGYEVVDFDLQHSHSISPGKKKCDCCSIYKMDFIDWFNIKRGCTASMHIPKPDIKRMKTTTDEDVKPIEQD